MPKESDYFEEAYRLCGDSDPFISRTAEALYQHMRARYAESGLSPKGGFNILYFFQSAICVLLMEHPEITLTTKLFPYPCNRINAVNYPDELRKWSVHQNAELVGKYLDLVRGESDPAGDDFDVSYAIEILASVLDGPTSERIFSPGEERTPGDGDDSSVVDFDTWLSGFNTGSGNGGNERKN